MFSCHYFDDLGCGAVQSKTINDFQDFNSFSMTMTSFFNAPLKSLFFWFLLTSQQHQRQVDFLLASKRNVRLIA